jgi:hypothetical protein
LLLQEIELLFSGGFVPLGKVGHSLSTGAEVKQIRICNCALPYFFMAMSLIS